MDIDIAKSCGKTFVEEIVVKKSCKKWCKTLLKRKNAQIMVERKFSCKRLV